MGEITFDGWAVLELMGHRQRAGMVKDVEMFGGKLLRIDIPMADGVMVTEFYGCGSVYSLRPCTEEIAREHVKRAYDGDVRPIRPVDYRERDKLGGPRPGSWSEDQGGDPAFNYEAEDH